MKQAQAHFDERADLDQLHQAVALWEQALSEQALRPSAALQLARAEYLLGKHLQLATSEQTSPDDASDSDQPDQALAHFTRGVEFAETALGAELEKLRQPRATERLQALFGPEAAPALYWHALNTWERAQAVGFVEVATAADDAELIMRFCQAAAPHYDSAGPDRALGAMRADAPAFARRDLPSSRAHFERALSISPDYLLTRLLFAKTYSVAAQNRSVFEQQLASVLQSEVPPGDQHAPENALAQQAAGLLLARAAERFE